MNKKILLLSFIMISITFVACKQFDTTATVINATGNYVSIDPILGQDYKLLVIPAANQITIGITANGTDFVDGAGGGEVIDKIFQEEGSSNYSFQTGIISGNFSILSADQIKISFVRNTPPYISVRDVICSSDNNP